MVSSHELPSPQREPRTLMQWEEIINSKPGFTTQVSESFLDKIQTSKRGKDRLTRLPTDSDRHRRSIARSLANALKEGQNFAVMYADLDNLKTANEIERSFGDAMIKTGAARVCNKIAEISNLENVTVHTIRPSKAADETITWFFGLTDQQLAELNQIGADLNRETQTFSDDMTRFDVSNSVTVVSSKDEFFADKINSETLWIQRNRRLPWKLLNQFTNYADDRTSLLKIQKDMRRLPSEQLASLTESDSGIGRVIAVKNLLVDILGNTRIGRPLLMASFHLIESEIRMEELSKEQIVTRLCEEMNIDPISFYTVMGSDIDRALIEVRIAYLDHILHQEYESAGFST